MPFFSLLCSLLRISLGVLHSGLSVFERYLAGKKTADMQLFLATCIYLINPVRLEGYL